MEDPSKDFEKLQQSFVKFTAEMRTLEEDITELKKKIAAIDARHATVRVELARVQAERAAKDNEYAMLKAHVESVESQIKTYVEEVRPRLLNELKQAKEHHVTKEKWFKETIEKYEKIWEEYQVAYSKWPMVAERNAAVQRANEARIECMKKRQEALELQEKAKRLHEIKVQQLEAAKKRYLENLAKNKLLEQEREELEKKVAEKRARNAQLKAAKQQRLEEELKQLKDQEEQTAKTEAASANPVKTRGFNIPVFKVPELLKNLNFPLPRFPSVGSEALTSSTASILPLERFGSQQNSLPFVSSSPNTLIPSVSTSSVTEQAYASKTILKSNSNAQQQLVQGGTEFGAGHKKVQDSVFLDPTISDVCKPFKEMNNVTPSSPMSSGGNKKESILSTDDIAAKLKETIRPNPMGPEEFSKTKDLKQSSSKDMDGVASSSQEDLFREEYNLLPQDTSEPMETGQPGNEMVVQTNSFDAEFVQSSPALSSSHSADNDNIPMGDDNCYDFNSEYVDDMYTSLQSPPPFEPVSSPEHAGFGSPPSKDSDEAQDADQPSSFAGFSFFSQPSTNVFGGQSSSEKKGSEKDKSASKFSFLF